MADKVKIPAGMLSLMSKNKKPASAVGTLPELDSALKTLLPPAESEAESLEPVSPGPMDSVETEVESAAQVPEAENQGKSSAEEFRKALDQLDKYCATEFDPVSLAMSRDIVKRVMLELREFPEYAGIVQDGDVRNLFVFLRRTAAIARLDQGKRKETAKKKEPKIKIGKLAQLGATPISLDGLGGMDTSMIDSVLGLKK